MRGPKAALLSLSQEEREALEKLVRRHSTPQQLVLRGRIVLGAADSKGNSEIAREVGLGVERVREWRMRWIGLQAASLSELPVEERLSDLPRAGRPSEISTEQICQIVAMACEQPKERPISYWTGREIAQEVERRGIVQHISPRHASRLLKKGTSSHT
ncbi:MAG: helix-turn-helix domain-containing protein [Ktedonobacteraceae bacterium]